MKKEVSHMKNLAGPTESPRHALAGKITAIKKIGMRLVSIYRTLHCAAQAIQKNLIPTVYGILSPRLNTLPATRSGSPWHDPYPRFRFGVPLPPACFRFGPVVPGAEPAAGRGAALYIFRPCWIVFPAVVVHSK